MIVQKSQQQQQQEIQMMFNTAFENRMKKQMYEGAANLISELVLHFKLCLFNYSINSLKFTAEQLKELLNKQGSFSYFDVGCMIQVVKGAPLSTNTCNLVNVVEFYEMMEALDNDFSKFANQASKEVEKEVKTKVEIMRK